MGSDVWKAGFRLGIRMRKTDKKDTYGWNL